MTPTAEARTPPDAHLHAAAQLSLAALFLGVVAIASLPAIPGWLPAWLLLSPVASFTATCVLLWTRRRAAPVAVAVARPRRHRSPAAMARRRPARRPAARLLAAIVLR